MSRRQRWVWGLGGAGLLLLLVLHFALGCFALLPALSDDGLHFYDAQLVARGTLPYRDFFFAHPPLHLLPTAVLFSLVPTVPFVAGKIVLVVMAAAIGLGAAAATTAVAREAPALLQAVAALATAAAVLFSDTFLTWASHDTGVTQALAWATVATLLLIYQRPMAAGALGAAAVFTMWQVVPMVVVLAGAALAQARRGRLAPGLAFAIGFSILSVVVVAALLAFAGRAFLDQALLFHVKKVGAPGEPVASIVRMLVDDWFLFSAACAGALIVAVRPGLPRALALGCVAALVLQLAAVATRSRAFGFYLLPAVPAAGCLVGLGVLGLGREVLAIAARHRLFRPLAATGVAVVWLALVTVARPPATLLVHLARNGQPTSVTFYRFKDAPGLGRGNAAIRRLLWAGEARRDGRRHSPIAEFLWRRSRWLDSHARMVATVRAIAARRPGTTLLGDSLTAPLVALEAKVPITVHFVDTNPQRFDAGFASMTLLVTVLDRAVHPLVLLRRGGLGLNSDPVLLAHLRAGYREVASFRTATGVEHVLYERKDRA